MERVRCRPLPAPRSAEMADLDQATRPASRAASDSVTALRQTAVVELRWSTAAPSALDRAVSALERARLRAPDDPVIANDLAVAYVALAERDQQLRPMLYALDLVERALARRPSFLPALFNRALILERLYLAVTARQAWEQYLALERDPEWAAEARAHIRRMTGRVASAAWVDPPESLLLRSDVAASRELAARTRQSPQGAREFSLTLFREWGRAVEQQDVHRAATLLDRAREMAATLDSLGGDRSVALAVQAIDARAADPRGVRQLARGYVQLNEGLRRFGAASFEDAGTRLAAAERSLHRLGSPSARWAGFYRAASHVSRGEYAVGDAMFRRLLAESTPDEPALAGKILLALGVSQVRRGNYERATELYREAAPFVARSAEAENAGFVASLLTDALTLAGQRVASREAAYRALRLLSPFQRSNYLSNHLQRVAAAARTEGWILAAVSITEEALAVVRAVGKPDVTALALCARARDLAALRRVEAAEADLIDAARWAERMAPGQGRNRIRAAVNLERGRLLRTRDAAAALPMLVAAVASYRGFGTDLYLPAALYEAAMAARAMNRPAQSRQWLAEAIALVERQQASSQTAELRATLAETVENVFDAMVAGEIDDGRPASAFEYVERGRIAAWPRGGDGQAAITPPGTRLGPAAAGARLPAGMTLVEYAVLADRLVIWTASRRGWSHHVVAMPRDSVAALVDGLTGALTIPDTSARGAAARLYDALLRPLAGALADGDGVVVVPDRELHQVPFVALWDHRAARYAVEAYEFRGAPSAAFFLATRATPRLASSDSRAVVVGNPTIDESRMLQLPPLPGAQREAARVAESYRHAIALIGPDARRDSLVTLLRTADVAHFAGHAVFNSDQPELSYLALAPDATSDGTLQAREIGGLRLSNLRVVVLSACRSLNPRASRTGAVAGLAYSFLRAGAPAIVSTLWDVDDETSTELLADFHRNLAGRAPAARALRLAQLRALQSAVPAIRAPRTWAAFTYTGP